MYVDSHAHLTSPQVADQVEEILTRADEQGIRAVVNICTDSVALEKGFKLAHRHRTVFNAAAVTPHDVLQIGEQFFPLLTHHARAGALIAIGETGLDYHYERSPKDLQRQYLERHLQLALETGLPVIFHCRNAFDDLLQWTEGIDIAAVLHCFTGTLQEAKRCLNRGWMISLSGIVTFKNSETLREIARWVPLDQMLLETDTPYLAPLSKRGKMNEPSFIVETASTIARLKEVQVEEVGRVTSRNAAQFFSFPKQIINV